MLLQPAAAELSKTEEMLGAQFQALLLAEGCSPQASAHTCHHLPSLGAGTLLAPSLGPLLFPGMGKGKAGEQEEGCSSQTELLTHKMNLRRSIRQSAKKTKMGHYTCALRSKLPPASLTGL